MRGTMTVRLLRFYMTEIPQGEHAYFSFLDLLTLALVLEAIPDFTHEKVWDGVVCLFLAITCHAVGVRWKVSLFLVPPAIMTLLAYAGKWCLTMNAPTRYIIASVVGAIILPLGVAAYAWLKVRPNPPATAAIQNPPSNPAPVPESRNTGTKDSAPSKPARAPKKSAKEKAGPTPSDTVQPQSRSSSPPTYEQKCENSACAQGPNSHAEFTQYGPPPPTVLVAPDRLNQPVIMHDHHWYSSSFHVQVAGSMVSRVVIKATNPFVVGAGASVGVGNGTTCSPDPKGGSAWCSIVGLPLGTNSDTFSLTTTEPIEMKDVALEWDCEPQCKKQ